MLSDYFYPEYNIGLSITIPWWLVLVIIVGIIVYKYIQWKEIEEEPFDMIKVPKKVLTFDGHCVKEAEHRIEKPTWRAYVVNDAETRHRIRISIDKNTGDIASVRFLGYINGEGEIIKEPLAKDQIK